MKSTWPIGMLMSILRNRFCCSSSGKIIHAQETSSFWPVRGKCLLPSWNMCIARANCLRLLAHWVRLAASRACWTAGNVKPTKMPMMAMTTSNSTSVNPRRWFFDIAFSLGNPKPRDECNDSRG